MDLTQVRVCEVGPRDGLQNEPETFEPEIRAQLIQRLGRTGLSRIEAVSFVRADRVPQMADAETVLAQVAPRPGIGYAGLVLNERGLERLLATDCAQVNTAFCVTDTFNRRNQGRGVRSSVAETLRVVGAAHRAGRRVAVTLAAAFGCPFEGGVDPERVVDLAVEVAQAVPDEIVLADTIGVATPWHVRRLVTAVDRAVSFPVGVHLHNTRNTGYANAYAAIEAGAVTLDASIGGIGGCPFAPNATGNIATEDLLNMLQAEGVETGVDLDEVIRTAEWVERLLGRQVPGHLSRAGRFDVATRQV